jgi:hypothetical protein
MIAALLEEVNRYPRPDFSLFVAANEKARAPLSARRIEFEDHRFAVGADLREPSWMCVDFVSSSHIVQYRQQRVGQHTVSSQKDGA